MVQTLPELRINPSPLLPWTSIEFCVDFPASLKFFPEGYRNKLIPPCRPYRLSNSHGFKGGLTSDAPCCHFGNSVTNLLNFTITDSCGG